MSTPSENYDIPDQSFYTPLFSPWEGYGDFSKYFELAKPYTLVSADRCHILLNLAKQVARLSGDWIECGIYKGGTAILLSKLVLEEHIDIKFHLFDTFQGMPKTSDKYDYHKLGDFSDTSLESVSRRINSLDPRIKDFVKFHQGFMPDTFKNCNIQKIALAHIDVDVYQSVTDCCKFVYSKLISGGIIVFDDYGFPSCPGARKAIDEYFDEKPENPIVLPSGQAILLKH